MIVCVVGSGAREHALAHVLSRTANVIVTPGNDGMLRQQSAGHTITVSKQSPENIEADLYVVGPEVPLVDGLADRLRANGRVVFGPSIDGARLEGSKAFMKELAECARVPTARFGVFDRADDAIGYLSKGDPPYVVKTDGLAGGKGVLVTNDLDEAKTDVVRKISGEAFGGAGRRVVIEEGLVGPELSLLVLFDGTTAVALPPAQDYKRIGDGNTGPNTGGMGAYSPVPAAPDHVVDSIMKTIIIPTTDELRLRGIDYRGVLYAGCMLTADGPKLIEYNIRFGDPEAEVILPRLSGDVAGLLHEVASGRLRSIPEVVDAAAVCVVLASAGYPGQSTTGEPISGIARAGRLEGVSLFYGSTYYDGELRSGGGRVLTVSALAPTLGQARARAYEAVNMVTFDGMQYRADVASGLEVDGHRDMFANLAEGTNP